MTLLLNLHHHLPDLLNRGVTLGAPLQVAALCWRMRGGKVQVLLVESRGGKRWTLPKGWPIDGLDAARSAAQEAWEEAGVRGAVQPRALGVFTYRKRGRQARLPHVAVVFALQALAQDKRYPERRLRRRRWVGRKRAAHLVESRELAAMLRQFQPPPTLVAHVDQDAPEAISCSDKTGGYR